MNVTLQFWELIMLLIAFFGCIGGFGKVLIDQFEKRLGERFEAIEKSRAEGRRVSQEMFGRIEEEQRSLERTVLGLKADLPVNYVRREDHIRFETVINAKLDAVAARVDLVLERQQHQG